MDALFKEGGAGTGRSPERFISNYQLFIFRCQVGFTGKDCETNINDCTPEPCKNDAKCSDLINGYQCSCQDGYTGIRGPHVIKK